MLATLTARYRAWRGTHFVDDQLPDTHPDKMEWRSARTVQDLATLTARWLRDDPTGLRHHPATLSNDGPEHEDPALANILARLNHAGFLTHCSQPGYDAPAPGWSQRAAVTGLTADPLLHAQLLDAAADAGMIGHSSSEEGVTVTLRKSQPHTWYGRTWDDCDDLLHAWGAYDLIGRDAQQALLAAHPITLADPTYGRSQSLWMLLDRTI